MKKTRKILLVILIIACTLISFIGGNAYAKYMSKVTGKGQAEIASWSFKVNENEQTMQKISLKSKNNDKKILDYKLAPGSEGRFEIKIDATGAEVGINYTVTFENETRKPTNLLFIFEQNTYTTLESLSSALSGSIIANTSIRTKTLTIDWVWPYETGPTDIAIAGNDEIDTKDGKEITDYSFDIVVTGTQMNPENI